MYAHKTTISQLEKALEYCNVKYQGNLKFYHIEQQGSKISFRLAVNSSKKIGHKISHSGRNLAAACWHAHGDFFDALFAVNVDAVIRSMGKNITAAEGN